MSGRRVCALLVLAAACASPSGPGQLTGSVTYRERSALPEGAVVRVTLLDVSLVDAPARVIAEQELRPTGQVPIPFALAYDRAEIDPEHRYGLHAVILDAEGRVRFGTAAAHPVLTGGAPDAGEILVVRAREGAGPSGPRVLPYACADFAFRVELTAQRARLFAPGRAPLDLPAVPAASGAKYTDGSATFWSKGGEAALTLDGVEHAGCRPQPLRAP